MIYFFLIRPGFFFSTDSEIIPLARHVPLGRLLLLLYWHILYIERKTGASVCVSPCCNQLESLWSSSFLSLLFLSNFFSVYFSVYTLYQSFSIIHLSLLRSLYREHFSCLLSLSLCMCVYCVCNTVTAPEGQLRADYISISLFMQRPWPPLL